eukprot:gb/GECH01006654.1/.p1 GENE.gb/GECH01006654.1/~~gb/GECH01006654.1/.p1  ORF type:complete len:944 (+),score=219.26 gb/GECH01006654.1/:1-2832(+)
MSSDEYSEETSFMSSHPEVNRYSIRVNDDNIDTIDWAESVRQDRRYRDNIYQEKSSITSTIGTYYYASQGWLAVLLVGIMTGMIAATIDTGVEWLQDIKEGVCVSHFWLNKNACCKIEDKVGLIYCENWKTWPEVFGFIYRESRSYFWSGYIAYMLSGIGFAWFSALLVQQYAGYAAGSGIPEVKTILSGFIIKKCLGIWTLIIKSIGLVFSVGSGMNLGKEGPFVHVACCCGNIVSRLFPKYGRNEGKKRELLSASAAAGVSVAFGAPLGGVLFSLEEASSYFPPKTMWRSFFCSIVAALVLQYFKKRDDGKLVMFEVDYHHMWHWFEILPFAFLGVLGGLIGAAFVRLNVIIARIRRRTSWGKHPIIEVLLVAAVTVLINYLNPLLRGSSTRLLERLWKECDGEENCEVKFEFAPMMFLLTAGVMKFFLTVFTFGTKVPAGLFIPSLAVGACFGHALGVAMKTAYLNDQTNPFFYGCASDPFCILPGVYALVGGAAVLGGVTRVTVSLVVIMFELTGGLEYVTPIMLTVLISKWVGDAFGKESIYEEHIHINGFPYLDTKIEMDLAGDARDLMTTSAIATSLEPRSIGSALLRNHTVDFVFSSGYGEGEQGRQQHEKLVVITQTGETLKSLRELLTLTRFKGFPVVSNHDEMAVVGYISRGALRDAIRSTLETYPEISEETSVVFASPYSGEDMDPDNEILSPRQSVDNPHAEEQEAPSTVARKIRRQATNIGAVELEEDREYIDLSDWMHKSPIQIRDTTPVDRIYDLFKSLGLRFCLVISEGRLVGIITKKDILEWISRMEHSSTKHKYYNVGKFKNPYYRAAKRRKEFGGRSEWRVEWDYFKESLQNLQNWFRRRRAGTQSTRARSRSSVSASSYHDEFIMDEEDDGRERFLSQNSDQHNDHHIDSYDDDDDDDGAVVEVPFAPPPKPNEGLEVADDD